MAITQFIGDGATGTNTWGCLRSPMFIGTGYRGTFPDCVNWWRKPFEPYDGDKISLSAGYPDPETELLRVPALAVNASGEHYRGEIGGGLGCNHFVTNNYGGGYDIYIWLALGYMEYIENFTSYGDTQELVSNPLRYGFLPFDTPYLRDKFRGMTVNLTLDVGSGASSQTLDVVTDDSLFPSFGGAFLEGRGQLVTIIHVENVTQPFPASLYWTINSVTLP